MLGNFNSNN